MTIKFMPTILIIFMSIFGINTHKNNFDYEKAWKKVDELLAQQKPKSALEEILNISQIAKAENNQVQLTKSVYYQGKVTLITHEDGIEQVIKLYESELTKFQSPYRNILESQLADFYLQYFNTNRYTISQRLEITDELDPNVRSMSTQSFIERINYLYFSSLENLDSDLDIKDFVPLLTEFNEEGAVRRPYLNNILANRVLNYLAQGDKRPTLPSDNFIISDSVFYKSYRIFNHLTIESEDKLSTQYKALLLYQQLSKNTNPNSEAWASIQYDRLNFVNQHYTRSDKKELFLNALEQLSKETESFQIYSTICGRIADIFISSQDYNSKLLARQWSQKGIEAFPDSEGARSCQRTLNLLNKKELTLHIKEAYPVRKPFEFYLDYKNIQEISLRLYEVGDESHFDILTDRDRKIESYVDKSRLIDEVKIPLNDTAFIESAKKIKLEGYPSGVYIVHASNMAGNVNAYGLSVISNLSIVDIQDKSNQRIMVVDRQTGSPVRNATVTFYEQTYNHQRRTSELIKLSVARTDNEGMATQPDSQKSLILAVESEEDFFMNTDRIYPMRGGNNRGYNAVEFFTDRAIYRPGQIVHFKGLYLNYDAQNIPSIIKGEPVKITIKDANYQNIKSFKLASNDYGTFTGSFVLPIGGLTGNFSIQSSFGGKSFKVEEYKRPTFEVTTDSIKTNLSLGEDIAISGAAEGLAGNPVSNSKVSYVVYRQLGYPRYCYYFPYNPQKEMVETGFSETDDLGKFSFQFKSKKENTADIKGIMYFYTVDITVTDPSGESRTTTKNVTLSDAEYSIDIKIKNVFDLATDTTFFVEAKNTEGVVKTINGSWQIYSMKKDPDYIPMKGYNRYASKISKNPEYVKDKRMYSGSFQSGQKVILPIHNEGYYLIVAESVDKNGNVIKSEEYIEVYHSSEKRYPDTKLLFAHGQKDFYEPGDTFSLHFGSFYKDFHLFYMLARGEDSNVMENWIYLENENKFNYVIREADRGGIQLFIIAVRDNQAFTQTINIQVPWTNKQLDVSFETFRDKIEPGVDETYNIHIKNKNGEPIEAELLMALYDASLDQFTENMWRKLYYPTRYRYRVFNPIGFNNAYSYSRSSQKQPDKQKYDIVLYPELISYNQGGFGYYPYPRTEIHEAVPSGAPKDKMLKEMDADGGAVQNEEDNSIELAADTTPDQKPEKPEITNPIRENLDETVFFFPQLHANQDGSLSVSFKMNDALTRWKLMSLAHSKDLSTGYDERFITTSKDIMILPNSPRFVRLGDKIWFTARIANLTEHPVTYDATLNLYNILDETVPLDLISESKNTSGTVKALQTVGVAWLIEIPQALDLDLLKYIASVRAGDQSDGEQNIVPVLSNKIPVTETRSIYVNGNQSKSFALDFLNDAGNNSRINKSLVIEYSTNPVWYAIQALPFMAQNEQTSTLAMANAYFANNLGLDIIRKNPIIESVFELWKRQGKDALKSQLQKNESLKDLILAESPWVMDALAEEEQKANVSQFFDESQMTNSLNNLSRHLMERQSQNGGFVWIPGGRDNPMTTLYILEYLGKLNHLDISHQIPKNNIQRAINYSDNRLIERYAKLLEHSKDPDSYIPSYSEVYQLYTRSYYTDIVQNKKAKSAYSFYQNQATKYWNSLDIYSQALLGILLNRQNDALHKEISASMIERSFTSDELGRYWNLGNGFTWSQLPVERHSTILDFFIESGISDSIIDELKIWLLKNKQVTHWKTNKGTAAAVYTLIQRGSPTQSELSVKQQFTITLSGESILSNTDTEAGTGYVKKSYRNTEITQNMGPLFIDNKSDHISWGGMYYQYLDEVDQIEADNNSPLSISKELYKLQTDKVKGEQLVEIKNGHTLAPGDVLVSRMIIKTDRDMEYINIKDMRGAGIEPSQTLSRYYWRSGLGYYHSIKDVSDNYFIEYLPKGTHVFEQKQIVVHKGKYGSGIATIQSAYAPEFSSHSKGFSLEVK